MPERDPESREAHVDPERDALLVERVLRGDGEAFGELVRRHMRRAFAIAYRILEHREDAEDAVQDSFIRALERIDTLMPGRPFHPWFYRIVVNRSLSVRRSRGVRATQPLPEQAVADGPSPADLAVRGELRERIGKAIETLPEQQRLIIQLSELEGLTSAEIGEVLEMAPGTVRWHLHQLRRTLRAALEPHKEE